MTDAITITAVATIMDTTTITDIDIMVGTTIKMATVTIMVDATVQGRESMDITVIEVSMSIETECVHVHTTLPEPENGRSAIPVPIKREDLTVPTEIEPMRAQERKREHTGMAETESVSVPVHEEDMKRRTTETMTIVLAEGIEQERAGIFVTIDKHLV